MRQKNLVAPTRVILLRLQMKSKIGRLLKWLIGLIAEEILRPYIILVLSTGTLLALPSILGSHLHTIWQDVTKTPMVTWASADIIFACAFLFAYSLLIYYVGRTLLLRSQLKKIRRGYGFWPALGLKWKYDVRSGLVEDEPYCPKHLVSMPRIPEGRGIITFKCDHCPRRWLFYQYQIANALDQTSRDVAAKIAGHYRS